MPRSWGYPRHLARFRRYRCFHSYLSSEDPADFGLADASDDDDAEEPLPTEHAHEDDLTPVSAAARAQRKRMTSGTRESAGSFAFVEQQLGAHH